MNPSLIVIRTKKLEECVDFYSQLGLVFNKEKHGNGPVHYASEVENLVFEVYPCKEHEEESNVRLGFNFEIGDENYSNVEVWAQEYASSSYINENGFEIYILSDPGFRKVEIGFKRELT